MSDSDSDDDLLKLEPSGLSQSSDTSSLSKREKEQKPQAHIKDDEEMDDRIASQKAKSIIDKFNVPPGIDNVRQLYWHRMTKKKKVQYFPCRVCPKDTIIGLALDQNFDEEGKVAIEYLSFAQGGEHNVVSKKSLVPLENECWNPKFMKIYKDYLNKNCRSSKTTIVLDMYKEIFYLDKILDVAKKRGERKQNMQQESAGKTQKAYFDELEFLKEIRDKERDLVTFAAPKQRVSSKRTKQELRAGDWIEYTKSIFVAGDSRGKTHAVILEVNPKNKKKPLELHPNDEMLPATHMVKLLGTRCSLGKGENVRYRPIESPCFQEIREHRLVKSKLSSHDSVLQSISSTADSISATIQRQMDAFTKQVKRDGLQHFLDMVKPNTKNQVGEGTQDEKSNERGILATKRKGADVQVTRRKRKSLRLAKVDPVTSCID